MGEPKAIVELAGRPLVARIAATVGSAGLEPVVVAKPDSRAAGARLPGAQPSRASRATRSPASLAALDASAGRGVVAIACDMPLVPARAARLARPAGDATAGGRVRGRRPARAAARALRAAASEPLARSLAAGEPMREAVAALDPQVIGERELARFGDPERIFFNVNTPGDVAAAERLLSGRGRFSRFRGVHSGAR